MNEHLVGTAGTRTAVPTYLTRFIGREPELETLGALLRDPAVHWITLTGPGGVGKTRLAIESIHRAQADQIEIGMTACFVPLFGINEPGLAIESIARRLDPTATDTDPMVTIRSVAAGRRVVLLIDNADGMVPHATTISSLLTLPECDQVTIVATCRRPFNRSGEHLLPVSPLPLPDKLDAGDLAENPSVRLFLDRAYAARLDLTFSTADLSTIASICRRLDGLPLALELNASNLRQLSLPVVAARIEESRFSLEGAIAPHDLPGHVALSESIASSFNLLSEPEREFLCRLSVFTGGISIESGKRMAAGVDTRRGYPFADGYGLKVYGDEYDPDRGPNEAPDLRTPEFDLAPLDLDPVDTLDRLVDQSLLQRTFAADGAPRYQFLETINEFALAELTRSGRLEAANHARMVVLLALTEAASEGLWAADRYVVPIEHLEAELTNLRLTLTWLLNRGSSAADLSVRISTPLQFFFQTRGLLPEGINWLSRALDTEGVGTYRRMTGLSSLGFSWWMVGEIDRAEPLIIESLALQPDGGYGSYGGRSHFYLALVAWRRGVDHAMTAVGHLQQALRLFAEWNDGIGLGVSKLALGEIVRQSGDFPGAVHLFNEANQHFETVGYQWGAATAQWFLGEANRAAGIEAESARHLAIGLKAYLAIGDRLGQAGCIAGLASLLAAREEWALAARFFGAASTLKERTQTVLPPTHEADHALIAELVIKTFGAETYLIGRSDDPEYTISEGLRIARALETGAAIDAEPLAQVKGYSRARQQVLVQLAEGKDVKEIAAALQRGVSTVYRHIDALMEDLNCLSLEELRQKARLIVRRKPNS